MGQAVLGTGLLSTERWRWCSTGLHLGARNSWERLEAAAPLATARGAWHGPQDAIQVQACQRGSISAEAQLPMASLSLGDSVPVLISLVPPRHTVGKSQKPRAVL